MPQPGEAGKRPLSPTCEPALTPSREGPLSRKLKDGMLSGEPGAVAVLLKSDSIPGRQDVGKELKKTAGEASVEGVPKDRQNLKAMNVRDIGKTDPLLSKPRARFAGMCAGGLGKTGADVDASKATSRVRNMGSGSAGTTRLEGSAGTDGAQPAGLPGVAELDQPPAALHMGVAQQDRQTGEVIYTPILRAGNTY